MTRAQGEKQVRALLAESRLERVPPNRAHADQLLQQAQLHLAAAEAVTGIDPSGAYALMYDAARKALVALLEVQGLRPTRRGGHVTVFQAARAQLDPPSGATIRPFDRLRRRRNEAEYPSSSIPAVTAEEVADELRRARAIFDLANQTIDQLDPFD